MPKVTTKERNEEMREYFKEGRAKNKQAQKLIWKLADKYGLTMKTIEDILYRKRKTSGRK